MTDGGWQLVFGYRHVSGVPMCPCRDPGNYLMLEESTTDPLKARFTCWCGRKSTGTWEDDAEKAKFIADHASQDWDQR